MTDGIGKISKFILFVVEFVFLVRRHYRIVYRKYTIKYAMGYDQRHLRFEIYGFKTYDLGVPPNFKSLLLNFKSSHETLYSCRKQLEDCQRDYLSGCYSSLGRHRSPQLPPSLRYRRPRSRKRGRRSGQACLGARSKSDRAAGHSIWCQHRAI